MKPEELEEKLSRPATIGLSGFLGHEIDMNDASEITQLHRGVPSLAQKFMQFLVAKDIMLLNVPECVPAELRNNLEEVLTDIGRVLLRAVEHEERYSSVEPFHAEVQRRLGKLNE